jgi:NitT/TauT family transport system substrate-binding protein
MKIRLMENFRALFYAPYYAALTLGFYKQEGVDVELVGSDTPGDAVARLLNGSIDLTWAGPMRVMLAHDQDLHSPLVSFCEVVARDPFLLIGNCQPFALSDLKRLRFATVAEVPTPWMCLQLDLREAGLDPTVLARTSDRSMTENYAALRSGQLDVMQAFEPYASMAEAERLGTVLYAASSRGPTVYTAFVATRSGIAQNREAFAAMTRAIARMEQWLYAHSPAEFAAATRSFFPAVQDEILVRSLARYSDCAIWAHKPEMSRAGFDRLGASFLSGGALRRRPVYEACVGVADAYGQADLSTQPVFSAEATGPRSGPSNLR